MKRDDPEHRDDGQPFVHPDPVTDAALNWLFALQGDPDDTRLRLEFETWRDSDPAHMEAFSIVSAAWNLPEMDMVAVDLVASTGYAQRKHETAVLPFPNLQRRKWAAGGMAVAAMALIAIAVQQYPALMLRWQADYLTAIGMRDEISLPDGSRMTLNTASAVSLDFEGAKRSVTLLQGEAYFDVVPNPSRPFTVTAAFSEVVVKGTAFSVRTEGVRDTIVLEHGHVDITRLQEKADKVSLEPGESITASATALSVATKVDATASLAWLGGMIVFEDKPLGQVLGEIGRYYSHPVIVANGALDQVRVNGNYRIDNPERAIRSLATAAGATATRLPGGILILR